MKVPEFADYTAKTKDDDGDEHESTVRAHVVTKDTAGAYNTRVGSENVPEGSVLVETDRPGVYDVHTADAWKTTGYASKSAAGASSGGARKTASARSSSKR